MLSRAADSLYWLSRYLERAETTARLIYNHLNLMLGQPDSAAEQHWQYLYGVLNVPLEGIKHGADPLFHRVYVLTFDGENRNSIRSCIGAARENARQVREQISSEMWEQLNRLYLELNRRDLHAVWNAQPHEFFRDLENDICLFRGITTSTMQHGEGWEFIQLGNFLERCLSTAMLLNIHLSNDTLANPSPAASDYLRWIGVLRCCLAFEAYCRQYTPSVTATNLAEFLILDAKLPRSLRFCADQLQLSLQRIDAVAETRRAERLQRLAGRLQARLRYGQIDEIASDGIHSYLADVMHQCEQIHNAIYQAYIEYAIEGEFAA